MPGAVPGAGAGVQSTAVSTLSSRLTPNAASPRSSCEPDQRVLAAPRPRPRTARWPALWPKNASMMSVNEKPWPEAGPPRRAGQRVAAEVVHLPLLRVAQHVVRAGDLLEALLGRRVRVDVGVELAGQLAVGLLDLLGTRVARDAEDFVEILGHAPAIVGRCGTPSGVGQDLADVAGDRVDRSHRARVVHPGRADDAEGGQRLLARAVAGRDDGRGGELLVRAPRARCGP